MAGTGDTWFTAPAPTPKGLFLGGYGPGDASPDIGDSAITETAGLGGMYEITLAEHPLFRVPALEFRGTPAGIDVTLVARTGILPQINTGMAGRVAGTGQVGAALVSPPPEVFLAALRALAEASPPAGR